MSRDIRFTVRMSSEEHDILERLSEIHERDKGKMVRWLIRVAAMYSDVGKCSSGVRLACVTSASGVRQASDAYACPDPARAGTDPDLKKEKEKKEESVAIATRVIGRVNELRPERIDGKRVHGFAPATYEKHVRALLRKRFTEVDMITVVEWKAVEHRRKNDWAWFKPSTLFRPDKFGEKLDEALAGVETAPASHGARKSTVQKQAEQQNFDELPEGWI